MGGAQSRLGAARKAAKMWLLLLLSVPVFGLVYFYLVYVARSPFSPGIGHCPKPLVTDPEVRKKVLKKGK